MCISEERLVYHFEVNFAYFEIACFRSINVNGLWDTIHMKTIILRMVNTCLFSHQLNLFLKEVYKENKKPNKI